jgi:hypothetical protein
VLPGVVSEVWLSCSGVERTSLKEEAIVLFATSRLIGLADAAVSSKLPIIIMRAMML